MTYLESLRLRPYVSDLMAAQQHDDVSTALVSQHVSPIRI